MSVSYLARGWIVRRADGLVLGLTDHDRPLTFQRVTLRPDTGLSAGAVVQSAGLAVDNTEAAGALSDEAITEADILAGRWDGAEVALYEIDWRDASQHRLVFRGHLGEITRAGGAFRAELRGLAEALNQSRGRVFHPRCPAILGDPDCGVDLAAEGRFVELAIARVSEAQRFEFDDGAGFDSGWFDHGRLVMLDGAAQGLGGVIRQDSALPGGGREVALWTGLGLTPAVGDRVRLIAGCDKTMATCRLKFRNALNFRGFPHLPSEDWLMAPQIEPRPRAPASIAARPELPDV
ncbi:MAG: DUF2163 domain-containing protein [Paracoccus sp. (in: a-proteobacteria)]|nr:DUF2163 domain-containing protein [Paracoccus sp. (in: a-proteobacteria)]